MAEIASNYSSSNPHNNSVGLPEGKNQTMVDQMTVDDKIDDNDPDFAGTKSTIEDRLQMERLGKKQQLIRHFRFLSTISFVAMSTAVWEIPIFVLTQGLLNGGRAGLVYLVIWGFVGFTPIYLSMAEMTSMAPTCGGQYHWVSEFASPKWQKWLSYATGWTSTISWQAGNALGLFLTGTLIQVVILENDLTYSFASWQGSLLVIAVICVVAPINIFGSRLVPKLQNVMLILHLMGYVCFLVPIWVNAPKATAKQVFTEFQNGGGWSSQGLAILVGQLSGISPQIGVDTAAHIAEEVRNASRAVPRAMLTVYVLNFCLFFPAVITLVFGMKDLDAAVGDYTLYPPVYVIRQSMSVAWETAVLVMIITLLMWANVTYMTAVSRDLWAFARDGGVPCSNWIAKVDPKRHVPVNAIIVTSGVAIILSLIYIGSPVAFYAITSLLTVSLLQCYMFSIGSILWRRVSCPETLPPTQFSLGRWGVPINVAGFAFCGWAFFWSFWPMATPTSPATFNWASVLFVATIMFAIVWYVVKARHTYVGPVMLTKRVSR